MNPELQKQFERLKPWISIGELESTARQAVDLALANDRARGEYQAEAYRLELALKWLMERVPPGLWIVPADVKEILSRYPELAKRFGL